VRERKKELNAMYSMKSEIEDKTEERNEHWDLSLLNMPNGTPIQCCALGEIILILFHLCECFIFHNISFF
jgi:hypothetical protein